MSMRVIVLTEAGKSIGLGHFVRTSAVCEGLCDMGIPTEMWLNCDDAVKTMTQKGYVRYCNWNSDDTILNSLTKEDVVIVDSYLVELNTIDKIKLNCHELIMIDDNIRLDYSGITIINPNIFGMFLRYPDNRGNSIFTGSCCTLLRKEFNNETDKTIHEDVSDILITMGGTDVKNVTTSVVEYIKSINTTAHLHIVVTSAYDAIEAIEAAISENDTIYKNASAEEMSCLMKLADFAVASAGGTTNELLKMLCPSVLIEVADNQRLNLKYLSENNYVKKFSTTDMTPIMEMFNYKQRLELYKMMKAHHSTKTGIDIIADIVKELK